MFKRILILVLIFMFSSSVAAAEMLLFVGEGCPHCATVEAHLTENGYYDKFDIVSYEIWKDADNKAYYNEVKAEVGYDGGGVPLLVDGNNYRVGSNTIISYLDEYDLESVPEEEPADAVEEPTNLDAEDSDKLNGIINEEADGEETEGDLADDDQEGLNENTIKVIAIVVILGGVGVYVRMLNKARKSR